MKRCQRCGHRLTSILCGFCLVEVLGLRLGRQLPSVDLAPFLRALFVEHQSLRKPRIRKPAWL